MRRRDELAWRAAHRINERTKTMNLIVQHTVRDYAAWKPVFDEHQSVCAKYGCRGHTIYRDADKPVVGLVGITVDGVTTTAVLRAHALVLVEHGLPGGVVAYGMLHDQVHRLRPLIDAVRRPPGELVAPPHTSPLPAKGRG